MRSSEDPGAVRLKQEVREYQDEKVHVLKLIQENPTLKKMFIFLIEKLPSCRESAAFYATEKGDPFDTVNSPPYEGTIESLFLETVPMSPLYELVDLSSAPTSTLR